ncbi:MAG TPA: DUF4397 domain-containing protein [Gemmatimonadaceae bacterium]
MSVGSLVLSSSCLDVSKHTTIAEVRVVNASGQTLSVFMDDDISVTSSVPPNVSLIGVTAGTHMLSIRNSASIITQLIFDASEGCKLNMVAYTTDAGDLTLVQLDSTDAPGGASAKIRALNLSRIAGNVDFYASIPGDTALVLSSALPVAGKTAYATETAGPWQVYLTTSGTKTKVAASDPFTTVAGDRYTTILLDADGLVVLRVLPM